MINQKCIIILSVKKCIYTLPIPLPQLFAGYALALILFKERKSFNIYCLVIRIKNPVRTCVYVYTSHMLAATCILLNWMSVMALSTLFNEKYLGNRILWTSPKACLVRLKYKLSPRGSKKKYVTISYIYCYKCTYATSLKMY